MTNVFIIAFFCLQGLFAGLFSKEFNSAQEQQLQQQLQIFSQAFNQGKLETLSSFLTEDAEVTRPLSGELVQGKEQILKFLQERSRELKERKLQFSFKPEKVDFPEADQAVVQGVVEIGNNQGLFERSARRVELIRQNGKWLIDSVSDIEVPPAPPIYTYLKEIDWLVGNWKDTDEEVTIIFENRWDKYKNFIISKFTMVVYDLVAMEGVQIIGWDPIQKRIESWVFDSDGGHGTGIWTKNGDSWEVALDYTLSDGNKASGTNVYTKVDDNHYRFASKNRKVNGEAVADIEPVTVAREMTK